MFEIDKNKNYNKGILSYSRKSNEFYSDPILNSDITFLVGYINIGFDSENNEATQIWGVHHDFNWIKKKLEAPEFYKGKVILIDEIDPGDSVRIKEADNWKTHFDKNSGWIRFGNTENITDISYVEFYSSTVMGIDGNGNITELWLHPECL